MWVIYLLPYFFILSLTTVLASPKKVGLLVIVLSCFVGFRYSVGWDYWNYVRMINLNELERIEMIPKIVAIFSREIGFVQFFFIFHAFVSMFCIMNGLKKMEVDFRLAVFIFLTFPLFWHDAFIIDRYFSAFSIVFYSSTFLFVDKKIIPFVIGLLFAINFHIAALIGFLFLIPYYLRISNHLNLVIFILSILVNTAFINFLPKLLDSLGSMGISESYLMLFNRYLGTEVNSGLSKIPYIYYVINVMNLLLYKKIFIQNHYDIQKFVTIFNIGCCLMLLFSIDQTLASRFSRIFLIYYCVLVTYYRNMGIARFCLYLFGIVFFTYLFSVDASHIDFIGRRNCYLPYSFFFN